MQRFAVELRKLRLDAGNPKYLSMARRTGRSRTALAEAAGGDHLPTWETVAAFVTACGGDPQDWRVRWERVRDEPRGPAPEPTTEPAQRIVDEPEEHGSQPKRARLAPFAATATLAAVIGAVATLLVVGWVPTAGSQPRATTSGAGGAHRTAVVTVQNKVAMGADKLIEDSTPAYLCAKALPFCADAGFKLAGTEMASGVLLVAVCHGSGPEMFNYNVDSSESKNNPNRADSRLWYRIAWPDGRSGYISEVYVVVGDRGGKGLPSCR